MRTSVKGETSIRFIDKVTESDMITHKRQTWAMAKLETRARVRHSIQHNHSAFVNPMESPSKNESMADRIACALRKRFWIRCLHWISRGHSINYWMMFGIVNLESYTFKTKSQHRRALSNQSTQRYENQWIVLDISISTHTCGRRYSSSNQWLQTDRMIKWSSIWLQWTINADRAQCERLEKV